MLLPIIFLGAMLGAAQGGHLGVGLVGPSSHGAVLQGPGSKTTLVGPDGSHIAAAAAGGAVVAPPQHGGVVSAAISPGYVAAAAPVVVGLGHHGGAYGAGLGLAVLAPGSGHEGQYVHDYSETLYDDGSYKGDYSDGDHGHYH